MSFTLNPGSLAWPGPIPASLAPVTKSPTVTPRWVVVVIAMSGIAIACVLINLLVQDSSFQVGVGNTPVDGMTIFAVFFVAALAIERLLEPVSSWLLPTDDEKQKASETEGEARAAIAAVQADPDAERHVSRAQGALERAAQNKADLAEKKWQRSITMWAIAAVVGMLVAASFKLYFLGTVGIAEAARWQEILATGLIIGAGTKPLHDLTELISAKKQASEAAS